jgi:hypothetical protein
MKFKSLVILSSLLLTLTPVQAQTKKFKDLKEDFLKESRNKNFVRFEAACKSLAKLENLKGVKYLLETGLAFKDPDRHEYVAAALSLVTDRKGLKLLSKELKRSKSIAARRTLCLVLQKIADKNAASALNATLKVKEDAVREAAASALGRHPLGKDYKTGLRRLLKDKSLRVRRAAAKSLNSLGVAIKGYEQNWDKYGCPDKVYASNIAILFDTSEDLYAPLYRVLDESQQKKQSKPVSAMNNIVNILGALLSKLTVDNRFQLVGFATGTRAFNKKIAKGSSKTVKKATEWLALQGFSKGDERDIYRVVKSVIDADIDEIYLLSSGLPAGGAVEGTNEVLRRVTEMAFEKGIRVHTIVVDQPPLKAPKNAREEQKINQRSFELRDFAEALAAKTDGHSAVFQPSAFVAEKIEPGKNTDGKPNGKAGSGKGDVDSDLYKAPKLSKGRLTSSQLSKVKKDIKQALANPKEVRSQELLEIVGTLPDVKVAKILLKQALFGKNILVSEAAIVGLSKNSHGGVVDVLYKKLKSERDAGNQVLLVRCLAAPAANVSAKLISVAPNLKRDAQRLALEYLAGRPPAELTAARKNYSRKFKKTTGLIKTYVNVILGKGKIPDTKVPGNGYLPVAFGADGIAFIIDLSRASLQSLWVPAKKKEDKGEQGADKSNKKKGKKRSKKKGKKKGKKKDDTDAGKKDEPISHLKAMTRELRRALYVLAKSKGRALVQELGESPPSTYGKLRLLEEKAVEASENWALKTAPVNGRDVAKTILRALNNPDVEEIYVMTCGMPSRADLTKTGEILDAIDEVNRKRMIRIHFTVIFGVPNEDGLSDAAKAARTDDLDQLEGLYKTLADRNRGTYQMRVKLPFVRFDQSKKGSKK